MFRDQLFVGAFYQFTPARASCYNFDLLHSVSWENHLNTISRPFRVIWKQNILYDHRINQKVWNLKQKLKHDSLNMNNKNAHNVSKVETKMFMQTFNFCDVLQRFFSSYS